MDKSSRFRDSGNGLLDRVPDDEVAPLTPLLETVELNLRQVVHQCEAEITHLYFPTTALCSTLTVLEEDDPVESAMVGREGFVGISAALGVEASPNRVICQMNGRSIRAPLRPFLATMSRGPVLTRLVHRYIVFVLRSSGQGLACNALHSVEARASRWPLVIHDQAGADRFPLTQEFLAVMLGVRRQTVTVVAGALQNAGLIEYRRGFVVVRDRARLEEAACECYASVRGYYGRVVV